MLIDESRFYLQHCDGRILSYIQRSERLQNCCVMQRHTDIVPGIMLSGDIGFHYRTLLVHFAEHPVLHVWGLRERGSSIHSVLSDIFQLNTAKPHWTHHVKEFFPDSCLGWPMRSIWSFNEEIYNILMPISRKIYTLQFYIQWTGTFVNGRF